MEQLTLFDHRNLERIRRPNPNGGLSIDQMWEQFHSLNPHIGEELIRMALALKERGFDHYSIKALWEGLRLSYDMQLKIDHGEPYRLNNNYTALYARWIMKERPDLDGFFRVRERRAGDHDL